MEIVLFNKLRSDDYLSSTLYLKPYRFVFCNGDFVYGEWPD